MLSLVLLLLLECSPEAEQCWHQPVSAMHLAVRAPSQASPFGGRAQRAPQLEATRRVLRVTFKKKSVRSQSFLCCAQPKENNEDDFTQHTKLE